MTKTAYISLNMAEYHALFSKATFAEMAMYIALKKLANFKTGQVGGYRQQKLNYERLGELLSRPKRGTVPAEIIDRNKARYLVEKLQTMGLVADTRFDDDALRLRLPLSPIVDIEEVSAPEPAPVLEISRKRQQEVKTKPSKTRAGLDDDAFDPFAINTDDDQYNQYDHLSINTPQGPSPLINTDKGEGTSPSAAEGDIHLLRGAKSPQEKSASLTYEMVETRLRDQGFRLLDFDLTGKIIRSWLASGLDLSTLDAAIFSLVKDGGDLVPGELDRLIRKLRKSAKAGPAKLLVSLWRKRLALVDAKKSEPGNGSQTLIRKNCRGQCFGRLLMIRFLARSCVQTSCRVLPEERGSALRPLLHSRVPLLDLRLVLTLLCLR